MFTNEELIFVYSRKEALADGVQVDANIGDLAEVTRQHYKFPVYMTAGVFDLMEQAVNNAEACNDFKGVWHDILFMSHAFSREVSPERREFQVIITTGPGLKEIIYDLAAECGPQDFDNAAPVVTIMLRDED